MVRGGNEPVGRVMSLPGLKGRDGGRRLNTSEHLLFPCRSEQLNHLVQEICLSLKNRVCDT